MLIKHKKAIETIVNEWKVNPRVICILLYGSVARGIASKKSDVDLEIFIKEGKTKHIEEEREGVKIDLYIYPIKKIIKGIKKHPFLTYPYLEEEILFERNKFATKMIKSIENYFNENREILRFWKNWTKQFIKKKKEGKKIKIKEKFYDEIKEMFADKNKIEIDF